MLSRRTFFTHSAAGLATVSLGGGLVSTLSMPAIAKGLDSLTIYGPPAGPSIALAHLVKSNALKDHVGKTKFKVWRTPSQLRAGVLSGDMTVTGTPSYVAANLFNRGVDVRMASVVTWGLLYLISSEGKVASLKDLKGKTILMPFKNDMPDLVMQAMARKAGLKIGRDFTLRYTGTPQQAMKMLIAGKASMAVLPEPAATGAQMLGIKNGVKLTHALDLQKEWGRIIGGRSQIPQAGMMVSGKLVKERPELVDAFNKAMVRSGKWTRNNPASAAELGAIYMGMKAPIIERSIPYCNIDVKSGRASKSELERFFKVLKSVSPAIIGGRLPGSRFYI
ncbi:MAG: ABC transporter substrate-binding protein [Cohaesibacter sp.]|jgi:NitT/TauT family transport system substrate-binding protein|nr:ABC transporter substrate-binding protein [Cohaesibacter sp.]